MPADHDSLSTHYHAIVQLSMPGLTQPISMCITRETMVVDNTRRKTAGGDQGDGFDSRFSWSIGDDDVGALMPLVLSSALISSPT